MCSALNGKVRVHLFYTNMYFICLVGAAHVFFSSPTHNKYYNRPSYFDFPLLPVVIYSQISPTIKNAFCICRFPAICQDIQAAKTTETLSINKQDRCTSLSKGLTESKVVGPTTGREAYFLEKTYYHKYIISVYLYWQKTQRVLWRRQCHVSLVLCQGCRFLMRLNWS